MNRNHTLSFYSLYRNSILLCTCIMLGFFQLFPTEIIGVYTTKFFVAVFGCLLALSTNILKNPKFRSIKKRLDSISIAYSICLIIAIINTQLMYHYSIYEFCVAIMPFLFFYFSYPLLYLFCVDEGIDKTVSMITKSVLLFLVIKGIIWILNSFAGIVVFPHLLYEYGESWVRNGFQRINAGYLVGIALAYCITYGFSYKKKMIYKFWTLYIILFILLVTAFRFQFIVVVVTLLSCLYFSGNNNSKTKSRLIIVLLVLVTMFTPIASDLIDSFSSSNTVYGASTTIRFLTIEHFFLLMINRNPVLGLGLVIPENRTALELLRMTQWRLYYFEDIGIFGGWFKFGILVLGIYGKMFYLGIKALFSSNTIQSINRMMITGIVVYMILSSFMLNPFDLQRAYDIPFYVSVICFAKYAKNTNDQISTDN